MSRSTQITCDECGAIKKEANHWWEVCMWDAGMQVVPFVDHSIEDYDEPPAVFKHYCSEECVHKAVSKYLRGELKP